MFVWKKQEQKVKNNLLIHNSKDVLSGLTEEIDIVLYLEARTAKKKKNRVIFSARKNPFKNENSY